MSMRMRSGRSDFALATPSPPSAASSNFVARSREEVAKDAAQVGLIFDDKDALGHSAAFLASARMGSSIWKVAP